MHAAIYEFNIGLAVVGFEDELRGVGQDQADSGSHEDLHEVRAVANGPDQQQVTDVTKAEEKEAGGKKSPVGIEVEVVEEHEGGVHADHHESTMGEVDNAHHAEDQRQAHADEGVEGPGQEAVDAGLKKADQVCNPWRSARDHSSRAAWQP